MSRTWKEQRKLDYAKYGDDKPATVVVKDAVQGMLAVLLVTATTLLSIATVVALVAGLYLMFRAL